MTPAPGGDDGPVSPPSKRPPLAVIPIAQRGTTSGVALGDDWNALLLSAEPATMVDPCGPDSEADGLVERCEAAGVDPAKLRRIVLTDSCRGRLGPAVHLQSLSGAIVSAHSDALAWLTDPAAAWIEQRKLHARSAKASGVPDALLQAYLERSEADEPRWQGLAAGELETLPLEGSFVGGGVRWRTYHTPGPSPEHVCLHHEQSNVLVSGALLLRNGTPALRLGPRGSRWGLEYLVRSWRRIGRLSVAIAWPRRGPAVRAHRVLIARHLAAVRRDLHRTRRAVAAGAETVWEVVESMEAVGRPEDLPETLAGTISLLEWLTARGRLDRTVGAGRVRYTATDNRS